MLSVRQCLSNLVIQALRHDALFTLALPRVSFLYTYSRLYLSTHLVAPQVFYALLFQQFYPKHPASFHLANIHNYFCIARKDCPSLLPLCYFPHTVSYLSKEINPFLLHLFLPSAVRYPSVIRSFSVLQSDNGPLIGRMR